MTRGGNFSLDEGKNRQMMIKKFKKLGKNLTMLKVNLPNLNCYSVFVSGFDDQDHGWWVKVAIIGFCTIWVIIGLYNVKNKLREEENKSKVEEKNLLDDENPPLGGDSE